MSGECFFYLELLDPLLQLPIGFFKRTHLAAARMAKKKKVGGEQEVWRR